METSSRLNEPQAADNQEIPVVVDQASQASSSAQGETDEPPQPSSDTRMMVNVAEIFKNVRNPSDATQVYTHGKQFNGNNFALPAAKWIRDMQRVITDVAPGVRPEAIVTQLLRLLTGKAKETTNFLPIDTPKQVFEHIQEQFPQDRHDARVRQAVYDGTIFNGVPSANRAAYLISLHKTMDRKPENTMAIVERLYIMDAQVFAFAGVIPTTITPESFDEFAVKYSHYYKILHWNVRGNSNSSQPARPQHAAPTPTRPANNPSRTTTSTTSTPTTAAAVTTATPAANRPKGPTA
ncbi:hypothetical protein LPJ73_000561 [Coemansia sp. RSA 2703]|nr:hypothetical protein LPJ73_000561 [Coemansia sp. RSA 2703]